MHADDARLDAQRYASRLLATLDARSRPLRGATAHPALRWAECGAMALTGRATAPPTMCPVPLASCADGALLALESLVGAGGVLPAGGELLAERAALAGLARGGRVSPGGSCRLLDCADGRIAVSLARADDWAAVPAWLGDGGEGRTWNVVAAAVAPRDVETLVDRGRLLSLAVAADRLPQEFAASWLEIDCEDPDCGDANRQSPLVVDLSSLWAGPLCTHLLGLLGARVIKVESIDRPDGARAGNGAFYDLINHGKASVALNPASARGRDLLRRLLAAADIVVEASRPRALRQLGVDAAEYCAAGRALTWISLTGHGRRPPQGDWIAFGDDAAVAAGLASLMQRATGEPLLCADAIADPLAGMHSALAGWWSHLRGGARRISLSLRGVVEHCLHFARPLDAATLRERQERWSALLAAQGCAPRTGRARAARCAARPLGADTPSVDALLAGRIVGTARGGRLKPPPCP